MSAEGVFHDAHEVYEVDLSWEGSEPVVVGERRWVATFATQAIAVEYAGRRNGEIAAETPGQLPTRALAVVPV